MKEIIGLIFAGFIMVMSIPATSWSQVATTSGVLHLGGATGSFGVIEKNADHYSVVAGTPIYKVKTPVRGLPQAELISEAGKTDLHEANVRVPPNTRTVVITGSNQVTIRGSIGKAGFVGKSVQAAQNPQVSKHDRSELGRILE